jgi:putative ABC transport system permease protein
MASDVRRTLLVLLAATASLLLLICANVTNLTLARLLRRDAEIATRAALGASPARIARQIATEVVVLSLAGGALGIAVALVTLRPLATWLQQYTPRAAEIRLDATVLGAALLTAAVAGLVAGLLPAMARLRRGALLQRTAARVTAGARQLRLRNSLIIAQVAIAIVLLTGSGLLFRSMLNLERVSPGFDPERVLTARVDLNWTRYDNAERSARFFRAVEERLAARPFVESVAFAASFPLDGDPAASLNVVVQTPRNEIGPETRVAINSVSPGYFDALGVPLLRGRGLTDADANPDAAIAAVVTRAAARRLWGDEDPIGRSISADGGQTWGTVVGVVADIRHELAGEEEAILFVHRYRQHSTQTRLLVRGNAPRPLETAVRAAVHEVDAEQPVTEVGTIASFRDRSLAPRRVTTALIAVFAAIALSSPSSASPASSPIPSRSAPARSRSVQRSARVHARSSALVVARAPYDSPSPAPSRASSSRAFGSRSLAGLLFGVPPLDPVTLIGVVALLVPVVAAAAFLPAVRIRRRRGSRGGPGPVAGCGLGRLRRRRLPGPVRHARHVRPLRFGPGQRAVPQCRWRAVHPDGSRADDRP